jgi:tetratricopeptide (TPR) repeat protein
MTRKKFRPCLNEWLVQEFPMVSAQQLLSLAASIHQSGQLASAAALYRKVLAACPQDAFAWHALGLAEIGQGRNQEALLAFERAIELAPNEAVFISDVGVATLRCGRPSAALPLFQQAAALAPQVPAYRMNIAEAHNTMGTDLAKEERYDEAIECYERALEVYPSFAEARYNLALAYYNLHKWERAMNAMEVAISSDLSLAEEYKDRFGWGLSCSAALGAIQLLLGHYREGWSNYALRPVVGDDEGPCWKGDAISGQTLFIHAEQGLGDTMQFIRYLPLARERSEAHIICECQPELLRLLQGSPALDGVELIPHSQTLPRFDLQCPLMSLPFALQSWEPLRMDAPYLRAEPADLGLCPGPRVGLVWAGRPEHQRDRHRSIPFEKLAPLLAVSGIQFHSFAPSQWAQGEHPASCIVHPVADFADTAAIVAALDLVITVDTAVAHLAGAMGKPVWILLPFVPDWRWLLDREDTPWYPSMRLFRQKAAGDWEEVIARVAAELCRFR